MFGESIWGTRVREGHTCAVRCQLRAGVDERAHEPMGYAASPFLTVATGK